MVDHKQLTAFNELEAWLNQRGVTEIECLVPDLTGVARGKILPREKFTEDRGMRLPEVVVAMGVTGEFPEEGPYYDVITPTDRDMHLRPDPSTVRIVPWAVDPTAQVIHDCFDRDGKLIPYAPRSVLRRICDLYAAEGWDPVVAPELEFYLVERNSDPNTPLRPPKGRSGRAAKGAARTPADTLSKALVHASFLPRRPRRERRRGQSTYARLSQFDRAGYANPALRSRRRGSSFTSAGRVQH